MKIERIETEIVEVPWDAHQMRKQLFVRISTDEGLTGIGESWAGAAPGPVNAAITDLLKPLLIGRDSSQIERLSQEMHKAGYRYGTEGVIPCAVSGIDLALWDLMGKRYRVPVAHLIGGTVKSGVRVYASFGALNDEHKLTQELEKMLRAGYTAVKLHDVQEDLVALARRVVGTEFTIMLDPTGQWSIRETQEKSKRFEAYDILWIEEPIFPMQDHASIARAGRDTSISFAAGENEYTLSGYHRLIASGAVDYIQPELSKMGGLTMARKVAVLGELFNYTICPHCYLIGPASYAGVQLGFTQKYMDWHEMKWAPAGFDRAVVPPLAVKNGFVELPTEPGLGMPIN